MSLTEKQKSERALALGSSDAPVICGLSPYSSPLELFHKLAGNLPRYDERETMAQKIGSRLEPVIAELAAEELNLKIRRCPVRIHRTHSFIISHADYEIVSNPKGVGLLEIKNRSGQHPWDELPDDIVAQVTHQLAVANRDWALVGALFQFGQLRTYEVQRDRELEDFLIEIEIRFMERVKRNEPPDTQWNTQTVGLLKKLYPADSGQTIALPDNHAINCAGFLQAKAAIDAAEEQKAIYEGAIKDAMKEAAKATVPGYSVSWATTKASQKFDLDTFKQEQPALYQQYLKTAPGYRRFTIKPSKELSK